MPSFQLSRFKSGRFWATRYSSGRFGGSYRDFIKVAADILDGEITLRIAEISRKLSGDVVLDSLTIDGVDFIANSTTPDSPEMAATPAPGLKQGNGVIITALTGALDVGDPYIVSYEITSVSGASSLYFPDGAGSPFANEFDLPYSVGKHSFLVVAKDTDTTALMRAVAPSPGGITFSSVSCQKAKWVADFPPPTTGAEFAVNTNPGTVSTGTGIILSAATGPLTVGEEYTLYYEVIDPGDINTLFTPAASGPFDFTALPYTVGRHVVTLTARDSQTDALIRYTAPTTAPTFGFLSCKLAVEEGDRTIDWSVSVGSTTQVGESDTPVAGELYVSEDGNDYSGTGAAATPFRQPLAASAVAIPGDTVYLLPGTYEPFEVQTSGTSGNPITFTTPIGQEREAVINGIAAHNSVRGGVEIVGKDWIDVDALSIEDMIYDGIYVEGIEGELHGNHNIRNNNIKRVGNSAILICGYYPNEVLGPGDIRTENIVIEDNDITETNIVNPFNINSAQGIPGGVNEAITVVAGVQNVITRRNDIHDSRQYGIDYKHGVHGGSIYENRIWNMERYGIYLDTNRRTVEDIDVYNNVIWGCKVGIVMSREADYDPIADADGSDMLQTYSDIRIWNNLISSCEETGIFCQRHPGDSPHGTIENVSIRFNTIHNTPQAIRLAGWGDADYVSAGVPSNIDVTGNLLWKKGAYTVFDSFTGKADFTVDDNFNMTPSSAVDPLFTDPDRPFQIGEGHRPTIIFPDFTLQAGSPALSTVSGYSSSPFDTDFASVSRGATADAGAYERA